LVHLFYSPFPERGPATTHERVTQASLKENDA